MAHTRAHSDDVADFAAGRMDAERSAAFLDQLEACADCSAELDLVADVVAAGERGAIQVTLGDRRPILRLLPLAAAAAAVLALYLWIPSGGPQEGPKTFADLARLEPLPAAGLVARSGDPEIDALLDAAMERYAAGDFAAAEKELAAAAALEPDRSLVHLYLGIARLQTGRPIEAIPALEEAARTGEDLVGERARWYLANALLAVGRTNGALVELEAIVDEGGDYELNARDLIAALRVLAEQ